MLRLWAGCVIVLLGKGGEGLGPRQSPRKLELNPAIGSSQRRNQTMPKKKNKKKKSK
jgi:hypothetical protein